MQRALSCRRVSLGSLDSSSVDFYWFRHDLTPLLQRGGYPARWLLPGNHLTKKSNPAPQPGSRLYRRRSVRHSENGIQPLRSALEVWVRHISHSASLCDGSVPRQHALLTRRPAGHAHAYQLELAQAHRRHPRPSSAYLRVVSDRLRELSTCCSPLAY